uniref:Centrosomal protein of 192 kDa n=1 Tax=Macrostomum lignano TaxID=282301 RepID=A0A1I8FXE4_9PLAT
RPCRLFQSAAQSEAHVDFHWNRARSLGAARSSRRLRSEAYIVNRRFWKFRLSFSVSLPQTLLQGEVGSSLSTLPVFNSQSPTQRRGRPAGNPEPSMSAEVPPADDGAFYSPLKSRAGTRSAAAQPPLWSQPRQPPDGASSIEDLMTSVKSDFTALARILDTEGDSPQQHHSGRGSTDDLHLEKLQRAGAGISITSNSLAMSGADDLDANFTEEYHEDGLQIALRHRPHPEDRTQSDPTGSRAVAMDRDSLEPLDSHDTGVYGGGGLWGTSTFCSGGGDANATQQDAAYYPEFSDKTRDILLKIKARSGQPQQLPSRPPPLPPLPKPVEPASTAGTAAASEETDAPPGSPAESSEDEESDISDFIINTYEKDASYDQPSFEYQSIHDILRASSQMIGSSRCLFPILEESSDEISSSEDEDEEEDDEDAWLPAAKIEEKYASPMETEEEEVALRGSAIQRDIEMQEIRKSNPDFSSATAAATAAAADQESRLRAARSAEELQSGGLQSDSASTFYTARESCESFATVTEGRGGSGDNSLRGSQLIETEEELDEADEETEVTRFGEWPGRAGHAALYRGPRAY